MPTLIILLGLGLYGYGAFRFWGGFHRTTFSEGKFFLTLLWPVFWLANPAYRQNFAKALRGR
jgi:hypothetical protein